MAAEGDTGKNSTLPKTRLLSVAVPVVALGIGGLFGYQAGLMDAVPGGNLQWVASSATTTVFPLPELVVTLDAPADRPVYMRLVASLEIPSATRTQMIENAMPILIDEFQTYLRALRPGEVLGAPGTARIKEQLLRRANRVLAPARANGLLIQEMIVQ